LDTPVTLFHVIERDAPQVVHGQRHLSAPAEAHVYLDEVATRAFPAGLHVERHVHTTQVNDVARSIVAHVGELEPDLIVMCAHGWGGLRDWLFGSIAQQVIGLGSTPVLLIQPAQDGVPPPFSCRQLLVPLDGDPEHEQGLPVAAHLAGACQADLHLVMVVHTPRTLPGERALTARLLPGATSALLDLTQHAALEYLQHRVTELQAAGLSVKAVVRWGDPAKVIVRTARRVNADLIVMGAHVKSGLDAFWSSSVAPQVSSQSHIPLLLVPLREPAAGN
jgi:nucleotide-binding universal stress UspA family protein